MQGRLREEILGLRALALLVAVGASSVGCALGSSSSGTSISGSGGEADAGTAPGAGGSSASGGDNGGGGAIGTGTGGSSETGGTTGFGGSSATGGTTGFGGSSASGGTTGFGGSSATGGTTGFGGSSASGGTTGTTGSGGFGTGAGGSVGGTGTGGRSSGTGGISGAAGAAGSSFCPPGAIFCADFEEPSGVPDDNPVGTATLEDPTEIGAMFGGTNGVMVLDTTAPYAGSQSLRVNPSSGATVRTLAIAVPSTFWVRLYIKSDQALGQTTENAFFGAGTNPNPATGNFVELAEQFGCLVLDKGGTLYPTDKTCGANAALPANAWHCLVAELDGATGNVQVFSGLTQIIDAAGWAPAKVAFNTFELGYFADNPNGATVWYDNVVVSASPLTCP